MSIRAGRPNCVAGPVRYAAPMDDKVFRERILEKLAALESLDETARESTATVELDQTRQGRLSRMDALQGQAMARAGDARRKTEIRRLKAALERLERGEYGDCLECGEAIAEARLSADPAATLCMECAEARE